MKIAAPSLPASGSSLPASFPGQEAAADLAFGSVLAEVLRPEVAEAGGRLPGGNEEPVCGDSGATQESETPAEEFEENANEGEGDNKGIERAGLAAWFWVTPEPPIPTPQTRAAGNADAEALNQEVLPSPGAELLPGDLPPETIASGPGKKHLEAPQFCRSQVALQGKTTTPLGQTFPVSQASPVVPNQLQPTQSLDSAAKTGSAPPLAPESASRATHSDIPAAIGTDAGTSPAEQSTGMSYGRSHIYQQAATAEPLARGGGPREVAPEQGGARPSSLELSPMTQYSPSVTDEAWSAEAESLAPAQRVSPPQLLSMVSHEVASMRRLNLQEVAVVLRPDSGTEISMVLTRHGDGLEVSARCERGDYALLNAHWPELRRSLEDQGVRMAPLENRFEAPPGDSGSGDLPKDSWRPPLEEERAPESTGVTPGRTRAAAQTQAQVEIQATRSRLLESWA